MDNFVSERMREFHHKNKTNKFFVYHFFYTGYHGNSWNPRSVRWGGIGVAPYKTADHIFQRYLIEEEEHSKGLRSRRHFLTMFTQNRNKKTLGLTLLGEGLTSSEAYDMENFLRPEGYNSVFDKRIWNTIAGGKNVRS